VIEARQLVRRPITWFDQHLLAPGSAHRLACVRVALALVMILRLAGHHWWDMAGRPPALYQPVPITSWLSTVPSAGVLIALQVVGVLGALLVVAGRAPLAGLRVAWLALLALGALHSSAGKIMHNEVLLLLATVPVLVSGSDARVGDRRTALRWGWGPRASMAVVGVVYCLTGVQKLLHSGPDWVFSENMRWVLYGGAASGRSLAPGLTELIAGSAWLPPLMAGSALLLELSAPLLIAWRRTRPWFALAVCGMHASIAITLGLDYSGWALTSVAVLMPWDRWGSRRRSPKKSTNTNSPSPTSGATDPFNVVVTEPRNPGGSSTSPGL